MSAVARPAARRNTGSGYDAIPQTPLARRLRDLRKDAGLKQSELANIAAPNRISDWEVGLHTPTLDTLKRYADRFGITVSQLLDGVL